jgi:murein DD-endopeptidase MepM/ murein hydrolase activator NlpD
MLVGKYVRAVVAVSLGVLTCSAAVVAGATTASAASECANGSYRVRAGDGWFAIARRVVVEVDALLAANDAAVDDLLVVGDEVCLPSGADLVAACTGASYSVRRGDGWFVIAQRHGVEVTELLAVNGAGLDRAIHPGTALCLPAGAATDPGAAAAASPTGGGGANGGATTASYTVVRGDSWSRIADAAAVTMGRLLSVNDATTADLLRPGDVIVLPAGAKTPAPPAAATTVELSALPSQGPCWYGDTWLAPRGNGRSHLGVDVFTLRGQYVYAVVDGRLTSRSWEQPGSRSGNAWMLTGADGSRFFYAHLSDFAPDLSVGSRVKAGQIIGWVGSTGNTTADHLHFEVHPRGGAAVNPYPILRANGGCNRGTPYTQPGGWVPEPVAP